MTVKAPEQFGAVTDAVAEGYGPVGNVSEPAGNRSSHGKHCPTTAWRAESARWYEPQACVPIGVVVAGRTSTVVDAAAGCDCAEVVWGWAVPLDWADAAAETASAATIAIATRFNIRTASVTPRLLPVVGSVRLCSLFALGRTGLAGIRLDQTATTAAADLTALTSR